MNFEDLSIEEIDKLIAEGDARIKELGGDISKMTLDELNAEIEKGDVEIAKYNLQDSGYKSPSNVLGFEGRVPGTDMRFGDAPFVNDFINSTVGLLDFNTEPEDIAKHQLMTEQGNVDRGRLQKDVQESTISTLGETGSELAGMAIGGAGNNAPSMLLGVAGGAVTGALGATYGTSILVNSAIAGIVAGRNREKQEIGNGNFESATQKGLVEGSMTTLFTWMSGMATPHLENVLGKVVTKAAEKVSTNRIFGSALAEVGKKFVSPVIDATLEIGEENAIAMGTGEGALGGLENANVGINVLAFRWLPMSRAYTKRAYNRFTGKKATDSFVEKMDNRFGPFKSKEDIESSLNVDISPEASVEDIALSLSFVENMAKPLTQSETKDMASKIDENSSFNELVEQEVVNNVGVETYAMAKMFGMDILNPSIQAQAKAFSKTFKARLDDVSARQTDAYNKNLDAMDQAQEEINIEEMIAVDDLTKSEQEYDDANEVLESFKSELKEKYSKLEVIGKDEDFTLSNLKEMRSESKELIKRTAELKTFIEEYNSELIGKVVDGKLPAEIVSERQTFMSEVASETKDINTRKKQLEIEMESGIDEYAKFKENKSKSSKDLIEGMENVKKIEKNSEEKGDKYLEDSIKLDDTRKKYDLNKETFKDFIAEPYRVEGLETGRDKKAALLAEDVDNIFKRHFINRKTGLGKVNIKGVMRDRRFKKSPHTKNYLEIFNRVTDIINKISDVKNSKITGKVNHLRLTPKETRQMTTNMIYAAIDAGVKKGNINGVEIKDFQDGIDKVQFENLDFDITSDEFDLVEASLDKALMQKGKITPIAKIPNNKSKDKKPFDSKDKDKEGSPSGTFTDIYKKRLKKEKVFTPSSEINVNTIRPPVKVNSLKSTKKHLSFGRVFSANKNDIIKNISERNINPKLEKAIVGLLENYKYTKDDGGVKSAVLGKLKGFDLQEAISILEEGSASVQEVGRVATNDKKVIANREAEDFEVIPPYLHGFNVKEVKILRDGGSIKATDEDGNSGKFNLEELKKGYEFKQESLNNVLHPAHSQALLEHAENIGSNFEKVITENTTVDAKEYDEISSSKTHSDFISSKNRKVKVINTTRKGKVDDVALSTYNSEDNITNFNNEFFKYVPDTDDNLPGFIKKIAGEIQGIAYASGYSLGENIQMYEDFVSHMSQFNYPFQDFYQRKHGELYTNYKNITTTNREGKSKVIPSNFIDFLPGILNRNISLRSEMNSVKELYRQSSFQRNTPDSGTIISDMDISLIKQSKDSEDPIRYLPNIAVPFGDFKTIMKKGKSGETVAIYTYPSFAGAEIKNIEYMHLSSKEDGALLQDISKDNLNSKEHDQDVIKVKVYLSGPKGFGSSSKEYYFDGSKFSYNKLYPLIEETIQNVDMKQRGKYSVLLNKLGLSSDHDLVKNVNPQLKGNLDSTIKVNPLMYKYDEKSGLMEHGVMRKNLEKVPIPGKTKKIPSDKAQKFDIEKPSIRKMLEKASDKKHTAYKWGGLDEDMSNATVEERKEADRVFKRDIKDIKAHPDFVAHKDRDISYVQKLLIDELKNNPKRNSKKVISKINVSGIGNLGIDTSVNKKALAKVISNLHKKGESVVRFEFIDKVKRSILNYQLNGDESLLDFIDSSFPDGSAVKFLNKTFKNIVSNNPDLFPVRKSHSVSQIMFENPSETIKTINNNIDGVDNNKLKLILNNYKPVGDNTFHEVLQILLPEHADKIYKLFSSKHFPNRALKSKKKVEASDDIILGSFKTDKIAQKLVISLFKSGNLETLLHESGHLLRTALGNNKDVLNFYNSEINTGKPLSMKNFNGHKWTEEEEEIFVDKLLQHFADARSPFNENTGLYKRIKDYLVKAVKKIPFLDKSTKTGDAFVKRYGLDMSSGVKLRKIKSYRRQWAPFKIYKDELVDRSHVLKELAEQSEMVKDPTYNPHDAFRQLLGSSGRKHHMFKEGVQNFFTPLTGEEDNSVSMSMRKDAYPLFDELATSFVKDTGKTPELAFDINRGRTQTGGVDSLSLSELAHLAYLHPEIESEYIQKVFDANGINAERMGILRKIGKVYGSYVDSLASYAEQSGIELAKTKKTKKENALMKAIGSKAPPAHFGVIERVNYMIDRVVEVSDRNRLNHSIINPMGNNTEMGNIDFDIDPSVGEFVSDSDIAFLDKTEKGKIRKIHGYTLNRKGKKVNIVKSFRLNEDMERLFASLERDDSLFGLIADVVGRGTSVAKKLITNAPPFITTNPLKDSFSALGGTRSGKSDFVKNTSSSIGEAYEDFKTAFSYLNKPSESTSARELRGGGFIDIAGDKQLYGDAGKEMLDFFNKKHGVAPANSLEAMSRAIKSSLSSVLGTIESAVIASESFTRNTEYKTALAKSKKENPELSDKVHKLIASRESTDLIDYATMGYQLVRLNKMFIFSAASMRALNRAFESLSDRAGGKVTVESTKKMLKSHSLAVFGAFVLPRLVLRVLQGEDEEKEMPAYYRDSGMNINFNKITNGMVDTTAYVPMGHEYSVIGSFFMRLADMASGDPLAFKNFDESISKATQPFDMGGLGYPIPGLMNLYNNYDPFFNSKIADEKKPYGKKFASKIGKSMSSALKDTLGKDVDPRKIDYAIKSLLFYWGKGAVNATKGVNPDSSRLERSIADFTGLVKVIHPATLVSVREILDNKEKYPVAFIGLKNLIDKWYNGKKSDKVKQQIIDFAKRAVGRSK
ncbi:MAG: LPD38 domain-containing protein [Candidatus Njordarchaeales archaeon]